VRRLGRSAVRSPSELAGANLLGVAGILSPPANAALCNGGIIMARSSTSAKPLTKHEDIRRWAERREAIPARVRGTGDEEDAGMLRLDFRGYSGGGSLEEISWDEWFQKFDEGRLALMVQEETASGEQSNFNKLVKRQNAVSRQGTRRGRGGRSLTRKSRSRTRRAQMGGRRSARGAASAGAQGKRSSRKSSRRSAVRDAGRTTRERKQLSQSAVERRNNRKKAA
jgi:hypothetical protein